MKPTTEQVERADSLLEDVLFASAREKRRAAAVVAKALADERERTLRECAKAVVDIRACKIGHSFMPSQCETCHWHDCTAAAIRALGEER